MLEKRLKGLIQEHLISGREKRGDDHDDSLPDASYLIAFISDQEEQTDQIAFHNVEADEKLIDCFGIDQAASIHVESGQLQYVIALHCKK